MPFGQSYAGLESLSAYRASVFQRMRTPHRAQYVGSMMICWCSTRRALVASLPRNRANSLWRDYIVSSRSGYTTGGLDCIALQPAHEPCRH